MWYVYVRLTGRELGLLYDGIVIVAYVGMGSEAELTESLTLAREFGLVFCSR